MITAAFRALGDLLSPEFRSVLVKALGLTIALFFVILVVVEVIILALTQFSWPWADYMLAVGTGALLIVAYFFLMSPVIAAFAGLLLDDVAAKVEVRHYPADRPGIPLPPVKAIITAVEFAIVVLIVNLAVLPAVIFGVGAVALIIANAYLLSREYFEMIAMRYMSPCDARQLRREKAVPIFLSGIVPALLSVVPLVNLAVPLFSTSYFVHLFKSVRVSST